MLWVVFHQGLIWLSLNLSFSKKKKSLLYVFCVYLEAAVGISNSTTEQLRQDRSMMADTPTPYQSFLT